MKTDLQIAQELKEKIFKDIIKLTKSNKPINEIEGLIKNIFYKARKQVKANLEGLGCGKVIEYACPYDVNGDLCCGMEETFCPDCLANGVDKAKAIYEGMLK